ncbi:CHC2 zinc finger domain-containing protein [Paenibacillus cremeus]|uniref:Zinc finger CHC2-type domain-containing protein n=1 Tax=Paenibacillus cremeus TaxID=2163881 RepID=A0A559KCR8_9BACL|nr:CHC2 zinc finger domain-containing protein [Paenibacillus cremeus]TVY09936.1 hypothetical protein FPZ49_11230 [Paenibacillus cremeus]
MKLLLDTVEYKSKPDKIEVKKVNNRIINNIVDISTQELAQEIVKGKTFVPALIDKKINGKVRRSINSWSSQEIVCLDFDDGMRLDEAVMEFSDTAAFIYTTFNHTDDHHKFRVVFVLDETIDDYSVFSDLIGTLLAKYPMADKSCSDGSRMFFGGNEIIELDYNNKLIVSDYIDKSKIYTSDFCRAGVFSTKDTLIPNNIIGRKNPPSHEKVSNHKELSNVLDDYVQIANITHEFTHINDAYDFLYKQDLTDYLVRYNHLDDDSYKFRCLFHEDKSPSASIFRDVKTDNYMYKCHSKECGFTGNIVRVVERLTGLKRVEAYKLLCKQFNIHLIETEWQKQQKEIMDHNIHILTSSGLKDEHPELYKRIKRYIPLLIMMNLLAKQYIGTNTLREIEVNMFSASKSYLSEMARDLSDMISNAYSNDLEYVKINSDIKEISKRIDLFAFLGVLEKIHINELPKELYQIATFEREKKMKGNGNREVNFQNFYSMPEYGDQLMTSANLKAIEFKENNMAMTGFGREMVIRGMNKDEADKVYPMLSNVELSKQSNEISEYIKKKFVDKIEQNGWVSESEILDELVKENLEKTNGEIKGKTRSMKNIKKSLNELVDGYGLKRERLSKKLVKLLGIEGMVNGYPFVIYKV